MNIEYTNRAVQDLRDISQYSRSHFGDRVTAALEMRICEIVANIARAPKSAPRVVQRPGMRVVHLVRYPSVSSIELWGIRSELCTSGTLPDGRGMTMRIKLWRGAILRVNTLH